ncbi:MAG: 2,3-diphosphoglycerate-dependent phosphoglycerate mutase [Actinobacteria bacterium]|nr:2,3-diphosphoglycerate-dependent phosphoglycerate mutase [Actinomycetota bacterium]MCL6104255.1 2,3-diphosphoglycerate-dependent phosphoglycerate mutase [Actinomycetota bacterium]
MRKLVILRHGESIWNRENLFTGWTDIDLSDKGRTEAELAGKLLKEQQDISIDVVYTSVLIRSIRTANIALEQMGKNWLPVKRHWRLNERHYGGLQGLNKQEAVKEYGLDTVKKWRRSYDSPPPQVSIDDPRHPSHDARYANVPVDALPCSESLKDVYNRFIPYWQDVILEDINSNKDVLVVAHGNSLRALVKYLEDISEEEIAELDIPTGIPRVYHFHASGLNIKQANYLGDPDAVRLATLQVSQQLGNTK